MQKLILFDTESLEYNTVLNGIKKHMIFDAKHGRKFITFLFILLFVAVGAGITFAILANHKHKKELDTVVAEYDFKYTQLEKSELHYLVGLLYLQTDVVKPNEDTVYNFIKDCNPWYPEYIMAQAIIESGCGTSDLAKKANNMFGMKVIDQSSSNHRPTTQIPGVDYKGYGVYNNWQLSVIDRILWELWRFKDVKPKLEKYHNVFYSYAESETYVETVISVANKYKNK